MSSLKKIREARETAVSAVELTKALDEIEALIPEFQHLTAEQIIVLRRAGTLDPEWVDHAVGAVGASSTVQMALGETYEDLRAELNDIKRWQDAESKLLAMYKGVRNATLVRRHRVGVKALQAYGLIKQLIRQPEHRDELLSRYEDLRKMNKMGKRKKKKDEENDPVTE